ncbi:tetratricopeptide repeat protein [Blattabacterium cuenoti]|uniref:tetratricopeptide repeat protein n=1 Tax=Blattabacterium cuenoti TaxID=1653831 RepID=UPI00163CB20B|nr:tetratricopeptide repeat protein [Blattabacterium cuenoti]
MKRINTILKYIFFCIFLVIIVYFSFFFIKRHPFHSLENQSMNELNYANELLSKGLIKEALNENKNKKIRGFLEIMKKYPYTKASNISKFYAGICYYKLRKYQQSINMMNHFSTNDEFLSSMKYGYIGDSFIYIKKYKEAIKNYMQAAKIKKNDITTPIYYYKIALLHLYMKKYKKSRFFLEKIYKQYPFFLYRKEVEKYLVFIQNKS